MQNIKITKGLDLPMQGVLDNSSPTPEVKEVEMHALLGQDYHGLKPKMEVKEGDKVSKGSPLFRSKDDEKVIFVAPVSGQVVSINRGFRRALVSVVIANDDKNAQQSFVRTGQMSKLKPENVAEKLQASGLWATMRTRPFSKVPSSATRPDAIFVNAMAEDKHSSDPQVFMQHHLDEFTNGVKVLAALARVKVFVCCSPTSSVAEIDYKVKKVETVGFSGKYPASLTGTHMHFLYPAGRKATNFWLNYQDTAAIGRLFSDGEIMNQRLVAMAGPGINQPRMIIARTGANIEELTSGELRGDNNRLIAGGVLNGRACGGDDIYLGRYHLQMLALDKGDQREFMGWLSPGVNKFSIQNIYLSSMFKGKKFNLNSSTNGSERAMVPMSTYEKVLPLNMLATQLLRSLLVEDIEMAEHLGCLELDEEDLSLCSFVCSGKYEYGVALRKNLERIEKENWDI